MDKRAISTFNIIDRAAWEVAILNLVDKYDIKYCIGL